MLILKALTSFVKYTNKRRCSYKSVRRPDFMKFNDKLTVSKLKTKSNGSVPGDLSKHLKARILTTGPITVAEYMREILINPQVGYYMNRDVFGCRGDFITSPEISQIFGELVGIWLVTEWRKLGSPTPFQLIELGPGRATLARDVLKVLTKFSAGAEFSMHLVEISPYLSKLQAQIICYQHELLDSNTELYYQMGTTATGINAYWYKRLEDVPQGFSMILAHEFFDALPVHKLQRINNNVWKEILIDVNEKGDKSTFRLLLSKAETPISKLFKPLPDENRDCLEYSLEAERITGILAERIERDGGFSLIMDYGHFGEKTDTFRAFKQHALHDPLVEPGTADITADVDFKHIKHVAELKNQTYCVGPVEQGDFLKRMQGDARLEQLLAHALPENQHIIKSGYYRLIDPKQMGSRFKFLALFPAVLKDHLTKYPVAGFS